MNELNRNQEAIRYFEHLRRRFYDSANETYWGKVHNATTREMIDTALDALRRAQPAEPLTLKQLTARAEKAEAERDAAIRRLKYVQSMDGQGFNW